ncbi:hypothetical protein L596_024521 [Steinernema carpocapsae]|uniref:Uncharacterized protein n=1 Tax=Steinernema carpocapsae TaxID=34508 RepID=A0A4U5MH11_STECR|nr:hypothetical protein L596_024521 [Steinernema carpocapsae]
MDINNVLSYLTNKIIRDIVAYNKPVPSLWQVKGSFEKFEPLPKADNCRVANCWLKMNKCFGCLKEARQMNEIHLSQVYIALQGWYNELYSPGRNLHLILFNNPANFNLHYYCILSMVMPP